VLYVEYYTVDPVAAQQMSTAVGSTAASIQRPLGKSVHTPMCQFLMCTEFSAVFRVSAELMHMI